MSDFIWRHPIRYRDYTAGRVADAYTKGETDEKIEEAIEPITDALQEKVISVTRNSTYGRDNGQVVRAMSGIMIASIGYQNVPVNNWVTIAKLNNVDIIGQINGYITNYSGTIVGMVSSDANGNIEIYNNSSATQSGNASIQGFVKFK